MSGQPSGFHDMDPCYLPDGRIVFTSTRPRARSRWPTRDLSSAPTRASVAASTWPGSVLSPGSSPPPDSPPPPVMCAYARGRMAAARIPWRQRVARSIPPFVILFLGMALLNTFGVLAWVSESVGRDVGFLSDRQREYLGQFVRMVLANCRRHVFEKLHRCLDQEQVLRVLADLSLPAVY